MVAVEVCGQRGHSTRTEKGICQVLPSLNVLHTFSKLGEGRGRRIKRKRGGKGGKGGREKREVERGRERIESAEARGGQENMVLKK